MSNTYTDGWAVVGDHGLQADTVASTRRAAIVNWLVTSAKVMVSADHSDEEIEYLWQRYGTNPNRASVRKVKITVV